MIYAAQDVVDYLLTATNGGGQDGEHRAIRAAVCNGYREVMSAKDWLWHTKVGTFKTAQTVTTGTLTLSSFNITAIASEAGWSVGRRIAGVGLDANCRLVSRTSATVWVISHAATSTGAAVTLNVETRYTLPETVRDIDALLTRTTGVVNVFMSPTEFTQMDMVVIGNGDPTFYTIMRSEDAGESDRYQVRFLGVPTNGLEVTYSYRYTPKPLKYLGAEPSCRTGTVSTSNTVVTGATTTFPADSAGSLIRFGTTTNAPDPIGGMFPYVSQQVISTRSSDTVLGLVATPGTLSAVKFVITDALDCSSGMYTAVLSAAEMWYSRITGKPAPQAMATYLRDLRLAMESDSVSPESGQRNAGLSKYPTPRSMGYYSPQLPDAG